MTDLLNETLNETVQAITTTVQNPPAGDNFIIQLLNWINNVIHLIMTWFRNFLFSMGFAPLINEFIIFAIALGIAWWILNKVKDLLWLKIILGLVLYFLLRGGA